MTHRILPIALLSAVIISNTSCNSGGEFKKLHGIEYKIVKDVPGKTAQIGDVVEFNIIAKADTFDLGNSRKQNGGEPAAIQVEDVKKPGQFQAVFPMLSVGDSAVVEISCDTMLASIPPAQLQQGQLPPWLKKGKKVKVYLSIVSIKPMDQYKKEMEAKQEKKQEEMKAKSEQQKPVDDKMIQDYLAKNNIKAEKTASGLYYTIQKPGSGAPAAKGQVVYMNYLGKTLEGKKFDANVDDNGKNIREFKFAIGSGQVIPGMDEGASLLKKGSKATLYIPSPLAYGAQSMGPDLPANSILIFDVEVTDIKAASAPQAAPGMKEMK